MLKRRRMAVDMKLSLLSFNDDERRRNAQKLTFSILHPSNWCHPWGLFAARRSLVAMFCSLEGDPHA